MLQIHTRQYDGLRGKLCMGRRGLIDNDFIHYKVYTKFYYLYYKVIVLLSIKPHLPKVCRATRHTA